MAHQFIIVIISYLQCLRYFGGVGGRNQGPPAICNRVAKESQREKATKRRDKKPAKSLKGSVWAAIHWPANRADEKKMRQEEESGLQLEISSLHCGGGGGGGGGGTDPFERRRAKPS